MIAWRSLEHIALRILAGKYHPKIKLQRLRKMRIWTFGSLVHQVNSFQEVLKLKQIFQKNKAVTHKTPLFVVNFVVTILFVLTLASGRTVLNGNDMFLIAVVSTKKRYSSFSNKVFVFQKFWIKVNVLKTFKISTDCQIKTCRSLKRRAILKIPSSFL